MALLRVEVVRRREELEQHAAAWDALAAASPAPSPLRAHAWYAAHVEHKLGSDGAWRAFFAYDGARLMGVLPLVRTAERTLGLKRARWHVPGSTSRATVTRCWRKASRAARLWRSSPRSRSPSPAR